MNNNAMRKEVLNAVAVLTRLADALAAPPEPSRIGQWLVDAAYPTRWYGPVTRQDEDGDWWGEDRYDGKTIWCLPKSCISDGRFLRIPPMPAEQPGVVWRECRLPKRGEQYSLEGSSILVTAYSDWVASSSDDFDGRRWIASPVSVANPVEAPAPTPAPARIAIPVKVERRAWRSGDRPYWLSDRDGNMVAEHLTNAEAAEIASALNERPFMERMEEWAKTRMENVEAATRQGLRITLRGLNAARTTNPNKENDNER